MTLGLLAAMAAAGCEHPIPPPVTLEVKDLAPSVDYTQLDLVLQKVVTEDGLVRPDVLKDQEARLDTQLKLLSVTGPTETPRLFENDNQRLAYWYNARAAWSLKLLLLDACPARIDAPETFARRQFKLDGRMMTLEQIDEVLAADTDWRTLAALPARALGADGIREAIAWRLRQFVESPRFDVDAEHKRVQVPPRIWAAREFLVRSYEQAYVTRDATLQTALLPYLEGASARKVQAAMGYPCVPMPTTPLRMAVFKKWYLEK
jgi:hypothetical protein